MARHRSRKPSVILPACVFTIALLTACGSQDGGGSLPAPSEAPATTDTGTAGEAEFYAQLAEYGVTLAPGGDRHKVARRAMNACPEYTPGQAEAQRIGNTAARFGLSAEKAGLVYSATVLHLCADVR